MHLRYTSLVSALALSVQLTSAAGQSSYYDPNEPLAIGLILFPGFQPLDIIGPSDIIQGLSVRFNITTHFIWKEVGLVWARSPPRRNSPPSVPGLPPPLYQPQAPRFLATHSFADAPHLDIILVPGGLGNRVLEENNDTVVEDFVRSRYPSLKYLLSVCTGAGSLAKSGLLDGRRATTSKVAWAWATQFGNGVQWVPSARWVEDGNIWTSSGVTAGMDMAYAFFKKIFGPTEVDAMVNSLEYCHDPQRESCTAQRELSPADPPEPNPDLPTSRIEPRPPDWSRTNSIQEIMTA